MVIDKLLNLGYRLESPSSRQTTTTQRASLWLFHRANDIRIPTKKSTVASIQTIMAAVDVQEAHPGYKPVPTPISPDSSYMSQTGWNTLLALVDGAMPAIKPSSRAKSPHESLIVSDEEFEEILDDAEKRLPDGPSRELLAEYIEARPIDNPLFCQDCKNTLSAAPQRFQMAKIMNLMSKSPGSLLLTGYWNPPAQQPVHVREAIVKSWQTSRLVPLRMIAKTLGVMAQKANTTSSPWLGKLTKYTDLPRGWQPQEGYPFKFVQLETGSTTPHELQTDVVIVGSGCGGSVAAKNLSEAGHKVMVVEKSYYYPPESLPMSQNSAIQYLYDNNGMFLSNTSSTNILTGSTWGGGGTINWSVSLKLQDFVREEWAAAGLPLFTSPEYDECIDRVWSAIGAGEEGIRHNHGNNVVLNGAKKLGWRSKPVAQNTADKEHYCGQCHLGCGMNEKRGPTVAWLPDAAEAGAEFMEGLDVEKILFDADGTTAIGVQGVWTARGADGHVVTDEKAKKQRKVIIKANKVIVSTGSIQTPTLLARSGVKNPQVGQHLHLHPCNMLSAVFDDDKRGWEGGIITSYCGEFENLDNKGHGAKIETLCMVVRTLFSLFVACFVSFRLVLVWSSYRFFLEHILTSIALH